MSTEAMSGAELKTRLGGLGLPPSWFADRMDVTMRTVVRWFDGDTVSDEVAEEVQRLSEVTLREMRDMLEGFEGADVCEEVTLRTFRTDEEFVNSSGWPASWHRALTFRVWEHLCAQGVTTRIEYV